jgi:PKD repeat protein
MDAETEPEKASSLLIHDEWPGPSPNDIDTLVFGPTADTYTNTDPDYYGPYTLDWLAGSDDKYVGSGRYVFGTATGSTEEWVSLPLNDGLHLIAQHNVLFAGPETSLPFTKTVGTINLSPGPVVIQACGPSGTKPITFTNSLALDGLVGTAYGLAQTDVYTNQVALQDVPNDASSSSYTQTLNITNGGRLSIDLSLPGSPGSNDLDLYLLHDANTNGTFNWGTELIASSTSSGVVERVQIDFPADGNYMVAVHGVNVPTPPLSFNLTVEAVQGTDLALSGLPGGPVAADSEIILNLNWNKTVQPGEIWHGLVVLGTPFLPSALTTPVYVLPCDPTGVVADAAFDHNGPLVLGSTAVFSNSSSGAPPLFYQWDFGDASPITSTENPTHTYTAVGTYTVTLTTNNDFSSDTAVQTIYFGLEPAAGFVHNGPVAVGQSAVFTNQSSGSDPLTYSWDFGDDSGGSTAVNPTHIYDDPGSYTVTLTATNPLGSDVFTSTIAVAAPAESDFTHNGPIYVWQTAVFTNNSGGSPPLTYLWNFGDGFTSTAENPTHVYAAPGIYTVTLTVTNSFGTDVSMQTITVREAAVFIPAMIKR